ncbi:TATA-box-binding protein-like [Drosophila montana]|uniref:TATA-box-binding protein-like n=1 Tax=Drosophila montana TaxID=40370 RepID=UPI00313B70CB
MVFNESEVLGLAINMAETTTAAANETIETTTIQAVEAIEADANPEPSSELDIVINNVVCSFSVRCHLKLREIALHGSNVEYRRENGMVTMRLRRPYTTASIWSSGRITCTGAISEPQAKVAARRYARSLGKLGFPVHFQNFRIVNVLGTCSMPWSIRIVKFSERYRDNASYEPELHPGVTYKMRDPKATMKIFSTGSITVTAASVNAVESAIQRLYPLVHEFRTRPIVKSPESESMASSDQIAGKLRSKKENVTLKPGQVKRPPNVAGIPTPMTNVKSGMRREQPSPPPRNSDSNENICGNARRRATECWASKLQKKRPRYNDAGSMAIVNAGNLARSIGGHAKLRWNAASLPKVAGKHTGDASNQDSDTDQDGDDSAEEVEDEKFW